MTAMTETRSYRTGARQTGADITPVIVTRGDVPLTEIEQSLSRAMVLDPVIWDNSKREDLGVFGRYQAITDEVKTEYVYVQDDDCLINVPKLLRIATRYVNDEPKIIANMVESRWGDYPDSCLIGWGAVFRADLPALAFNRFLSAGAMAVDAPEFLRCCDVIFTTLTPHVKVDIGFQHLPWAEEDYRMFRQPQHGPERAHVLELARQVRDAA